MHDHDIGDANVERLLETAYKPEPVDAAFAKQLEEVMCAVALGASKTRGMATEDSKQHVIRKRLGWAMGLAASAAACFLIYYANHRFEGRPPIEVVGRGIATDKLRPVSLGENKSFMGLTARPRPEGPTEKPVPVGADLITSAGERRRVILADGSVLYLNQNTVAKHVAERQIELTKGEVYLEVAPRDSGTYPQGLATFLVKTPGRVVSALGTRFGVQADKMGAGVIVTQGKVKVSGLDGEILAGQQLSVGQKAISTAARATHVLDWTRELMAAAESPLVPGSKYAGGALLALDPNGQEVTLTLRKFHVDVHIEDGFARTTIDQTYFNNNNWRMEGTFYFPLPPDASLSRLAMYVEDGDASRLMEGGMAEREHARDVFETIMTMRRDPALLEWVDGSTFKMRVFPLEGRKEKRILLSYTQRLPSLYGASRYRFPAGHNMQIVRDWSFAARVKHGADVRVTSASHPEMNIAAQGTDMMAKAAGKNLKPNRDVSLEIHDTAQADTTEAAAFRRFVHENQHYLMLKYRPAMAEEPRRQRRDWVILFETGANRDPLLARAQIDVVKNLLENVEHDDTFVLITANTRATPFDTKPRLVNAENVGAALTFLESSHLVGALDLENALAAARSFVSTAGNPYLVHLGAGISAMGERKEDVLAKQVPDNVRYVGIGVGKRWSRAFMKMAADRTGGYFTQINPDEPIAWRTFELLATLNTPRLMELRVVDAAERVPFLTETTSLAQGEEICALARTQGPLPEKVIIAGKLNGQDFTKTLVVKDVVSGAGYLPRTWAKLEIDRLLAAGAENNKKAIIDLSMAMYVMTPYTSLLVLETDQDYVTYKVDRGRKDHWAMYDSPKRIPTVYEPDPNQQAWNGIRIDPVTPGKKKSAEDVLATILIRTSPSLLAFPGRGENQQPMMLTARQLLYMNYAIQDELGTLNAQTDRIRVLGLQPGIAGANIDRNGPWLPNSVQGLDFLGGVRDRVSTPVKVFDKAGRPVTITAFGNKLTVASDASAPGLEAALKRMLQEMRPAGGITRGEGNFGSNTTMKDSSPESRFGWINRTVAGAEAIQGRKWSEMLPEFQAPRLPVIVEALEGIGGIVIRSNNPEDMNRAQEIIEFIKDSRNTRALFPDRSAFGGGGFGGGGIGGHGSWGGGLIRPPTDIEQKRLEDFRSGRLTREMMAGNLQEARLRGVTTRLAIGFGQRNLTYQRPQVQADNRFFGDLTAFAPGLHTSLADICATVESEATAANQPLPGIIDDGARQLIDRARSADWQELAIPTHAKIPGFTVTFNGAGKFDYERVLNTGLHERVVCDGTTLWSLYPEIGLGGRRPFSRYHHAELTDIVPWLLPKTEDLARGADLKLVDKSTVAIVSRSPAGKDKDGKTPVAFELHLVFAEDGRLVERQIVEAPAHKVLVRQTFAADGVVKIIDAKDNKVLAETKLNVRDGEAPKLTAGTKDLLVMEFPIRTPRHLFSQVSNLWTGSFAKVDAKLAEQLFIAYALSGDGSTSWQAFGERFHAEGDRRLGFYTLYNITGTIFSKDVPYTWNNKKEIFNIEKEHPKNGLATFLAHYQQSLNQQPPPPFENLPGPADGFIQRLAQFRNVWSTWIADHPTRYGLKKVEDERARALKFVQETNSPLFAWAILDSVTRHGQPPGQEFQQALDNVLKGMGEELGLTYFARYEHARSLQAANKNPEAVKAFQDLYLNAFKAGALPPIDANFIQALKQSAKGGDNPLATFLCDRLGDLLKEERLGAATLLTWQTWQLGEQALADELFNRVVASAQPKDKTAADLIGIEYLCETGQFARADILLQQILADANVAERAPVWRLASALAELRGQLARSSAALERAMDLEFRELPEVINLEAVRNDYRGLLSRYQQLATAITMLETGAPKELVAKVVKAADRWRSLDPDNVEVCQLTGRILQILGAKELAWDYVTTPIGMKPNEAAPWLGLAQTLRQDADFELADRAFAMAFAAEPTNADILWNRAQNLQQLGKVEQARALYRQIADGTWQPRFQGIQQQARWYLKAP